MEDQILGYRRRLELFPANREAFEALSEAYRASARWDELARLHEQRLALLPDDDAADALRLHLAALYLERLDEPDRALEHAGRVQAAHPTRTAPLDLMLAAHERKGELERMAELLERRATLTGGAEAARALVRLADVLEGLGRPGPAVAALRAAYEADRTQTDALRRARQLAASESDLETAAELLEQEAGSGPLEPLVPEYLDLGARAAEEPWLDQLARRLLETARAHGAVDGIDATLQEMEARPGTWRERARALRAAAVDAREKRKAAEAYLRIAQLHALYDVDGRKVLENLDRVFVLHPGSRPALDFLERWHGAREDWSGLVVSLEHVAARLKDRAAAAEALVRLGRVHEARLHDPGAASVAYRRALEADPGHAEAARALVRLLEERAAWADAARVLEERLPTVGERREQIRLRLDLAALYTRHLGAPEKARGHLETVLRLNPQHVEAARELEPLLREAQDHARLAAVLEVELAGAGDRAERLRLLENLAELQGGPLGRPEEAARTLTRALALDPGRSRLVARLEEAASAAGDPQLLARGLAVAVDAAADPAHRADLLSRLAGVREAALGDPTGAAELYRRILDEAPEHAAARAGLERVLTATGAVEELTVALARQAGEATDPAGRAEALLKLARHCDGPGGDPARAREAWTALLATGRHTEAAFAGLAGVLERLGDWEGLAALLERWIPASEGATRAALRLKLAGLLVGRLERPGDAAGIYCELFEAERGRPDLVRALEALMAQGVDRDRIATLLEPHYARQGDWVRHLAMLEQRLPTVTAPAERARHLLRIADVQETQLADKRQALAAAARALAEAPDDANLLERVERLARETGAFGELEAALDAALERGLKQRRLGYEQVLRMRLKLADLRENHLGDAEGAVEVYLGLLNQTAPGDPAHMLALRALARMAREAERWEDLAEALRRMVELESDDDVRAELLLEAGRVLLERLGDPAEAARVLTSAREAGAEEGEVLALLAAAHERAADHRALAEVLERRIAHAEAGADPALAARLRLQYARLLADALSDGPRAVAQYRAVLEQRPRDPDALAALERLMEAPDSRVEAARALAPAYERAHAHERLAGALRCLVEAEPAPEAKAGLLKRIAGLEERQLRRRQEALSDLVRAAGLVPGDAELRAELRRLADEIGALDVYTEVLDELAGRLPPEEARRLRHEAAEWAERRVGSASGAVRRYEAILAADPEDVAALRALHRLHRAGDDWAGLADVCLRLAERVDEPGERVRLWREAGRIFEEALDDGASALTPYRRVLETDPTDQEAARTLDRLYLAHGRFEDLAWVLDIERAQAAAPERAREVAVRLAGLRWRELQDPEGALALLGETLAEDPGHHSARLALNEAIRAGGAPGSKALALLDPVLAAEGEHRTRIDLREALLSAETEGLDGEERARLHAELRALYEQELDAPEMAFMVACRQLQADLDFDQALAEAERLGRAAGTLEELTEILDEVAGDLRAEDERRLELARRMARLLTELGRSADAIEAWRRVQGRFPDDREALESLEALHAARDDAAELIALYHRKVDLLEDPAERASVRLDLARLLERTGAVERAVDTYETVGAEGEDLPGPALAALEALDRIYRGQRRAGDLARVLAARVRLESEGTERQRAMLRLARLLESHDAQPARALELYAAVLEAPAGAEAAPDATERPELVAAVEGLERLLAVPDARTRAAALLEPLYRERMEGRKLVDVLELRLAETREPEARLELLEEIARLHEVRLGQKPLAFMAWCRAFREQPQGESVRRRLELLAAETGAWDEVAGLYEEEAERLDAQPGSEAQRLELHRRLSELFTRELGRGEAAIRHQRRVVELDGGVEELERLAGLLRTADDARGLVEVYRALAARTGNLERRKDLWFEIAGLTEEVLGDKAGAVEAWREALAVDPDSPDPEALGMLERLLEELGRHAELADVLARQAGEAAGPLEQAVLLERLGRLRRERLDDPLGAAEAWASALAVDSTQPGALDGLAAMLAEGLPASGDLRRASVRAARILLPGYEATGDLAGQVRALEVMAAAEEDDAAQADLLMRIAELYEAQSHPELAFMAATRALRAEPARRAVLERLDALAREAELADALIDLLDELLEEVADEGVRADYLMRLGRLCEETGELDAALRHEERLLAVAPESPGVLDRLAGLTRRTGRWDALAEVLRRKLERTEASAERATLLRELAAVQTEHLSDPPGALTTWERLLELMPDDREALGRADDLCIRLARWEDLQRLLGREAAVAAEAEDRAAQVRFLYRLATLSEEQLGDAAGALTLHREILRVAPGHPDTVARLEELLEGDQRVEAAALLEAVYRAEQRWAPLTQMLEIRVSAAEDVADRLAGLTEMARVQEQRLGAPEMAFIVLCRAYRESPDAAGVRAELERLADATGQHEELAAVIEDALEHLEAGPERIDAELAAARAHDVHGDAEAARAHYEAALALDPRRSDALEALDALHEGAERWAELAEVLERRLAAEEATERKTVLRLRLAHLQAGVLEAPEAAIRTLEAVPADDPQLLEVLQTLAPLYEAAGDDAHLEEVLAAWAERAESGREALLVRRAEALERLGRTEQAIALWQSVLEADRRSERALDALERLYDATGDREALAGHLRRRLQQTVDPREISRLHLGLGRVLAADPARVDEALASFHAVLDRDPRNVPALEALRGIHEGREAWPELVTVLRRLGAVLESPEAVRDVRFRLAEVLGRALGRREEALEAARRFAELGPHAPDRLEALEALFRELGTEADAVGAMEQRERALAARAGSATDPDERDRLSAERRSLLAAIARAWEQTLGRPEGAVRAWEGALRLDPADGEAVAELRRLYGQTARWRDLAALVEDRIAREADAEARRLLLVELAQIQEERLGLKEMAFLALGRALAENPEDEQVEAGLLRLAEETGSWDEAAVVLEELADGQSAGPVQNRILLRLAEIQDRRLDDPAAAEAALRRVLAFDPAHGRALEALSALFLARGQSRALVVALEQKLEATGDPDEQKRVLARIARLHETEVGDLDEAAATWRRIVDIDGGDGTALAELARLLEARERWDDLVPVLERDRARRDDPSERATLACRLAHVHEGRRGDDPAAVAAFQAALEDVPGHPEALESLEIVLTRLEQWTALLQVYEVQVEKAPSGPERIALLSKIAALHEGQFENPDGAIGAFDRVLELQPDNLVAIRSLTRLLRETGQWQRLVEALDRLVELVREPGEAVRLHIDLADVWHDRLGRADRAERILTQALEIDPHSRPALHALAGLYERSGNWMPALEMLSRSADLAGGTPEAVTLWTRTGRIQEEMLLDTAAARAAYERALDIDGGHLPALQALKGLAEREGDWETYGTVLAREAEHTPDPAARAALLHGLGVWHRDRNGDAETALACFRQALEFQPDQLDAARDAASLLLDAEAWAEAEPLLRTVCLGLEAAGAPAREVGPWWYKLGYVRRRLGRTDFALDAFRRAYDCDATWLPALEGLGATLVASEQWEEALKIYQTILIHHRDGVTDLEVVEYYWQLGEINRHLGHTERAIKNLEKALDIDPDHEPSLTALIRLLEEQGDYESALERRQHLLTLVDGQDRYELLLAIGRMAREELDDPYQSIDAYLAAWRQAPEMDAPLESLLVLYRETQQWTKALDVLEALLRLPTVRADAARARRYHYAVGEIRRDHLHDPDGAVAAFDAALDLDYGFAEAFAAIETLLSAAGRWRELEASYVRMIQRLPKTQTTHRVRMGLWKNVAELHRQVLRDREGAIAAYQVVCKGDPDDVAALRALAELLGEQPGAQADARRAWGGVLAHGGDPIAAGRALLRLATSAKDYDAAFVTAGVLTHLLGEAQPEEAQLHARLAPYAKETAQGTLSQRMWTGQLHHPRLKTPATTVFALLQEHAGAQLARDPKDLGLTRKDLLDPEQSMLFFTNMYRYVGRVLGMPGVPLYRRAQQTEALAVVDTWPAALVASEEMLGRSRKRPLWFSIGKSLAFSRPELVLGRTRTLEELELLAHAAAALVEPRWPLPADPRGVHALQKRLARGLGPEARAELTRAVRGWSPQRLAADVRAYAEGVEHTANRVGALLAGDTEPVRALIMEDRGGAARLAERARVRELVTFCLSEDYLALRRDLGIALDVGR